MRFFGWVAVLAVVGCATGSVRENNGVLSITFDDTNYTEEIALPEAEAHCAAKGLSARPTLVSRGSAFVMGRVSFVCANPAEYGALVRSTATPLQGGAYVACDYALSDCYARAAAVCPTGYTVAKQTMRGVGVPVVADTTVINAQTSLSSALAIGNGATANTYPQTGITPQQSVNKLMTSIAISQARRANFHAQAEAAKEYGKLWVVCGE